MISVVGAAMVIPLVVHDVRGGFRLWQTLPADYMAVTGLLLVIAGSMNFTFTLALHAAANLKRR